MGFVRVFSRLFATDAGLAPCAVLCAFALLPAAAGAAPYGSNDPAQIPQTAPRQVAHPGGERSFTDLYSVTWEQIPLPESTPANPHYITATSITDDGTIGGRGTGSTVLWHPDRQVWEEIPREHNGQPVLVSPDGSSLITTDAVQMPATNILTWNRADGWQVLAGGAVDQSEASSVSRNFRFLVGGGNDNGKVEQAWVWGLDGGVQQMLPNPDWSGGAIALAVSDDGNVVVGAAVRAPNPGEIYPDILAVRWDGGGLPTQLFAPDGRELGPAVACNADCSIVFGSTGWFLEDNGEFDFLGFMEPIPDAYPDPYGAYTIHDVSPDGSMIVGLYSAHRFPTYPDSESYVQRPFLWTPETGLTSLRSLASEFGMGKYDAPLFNRIRFSPDGQNIVIGWSNDGNDRVVVLHIARRLLRPRIGHSTHARPPPPRADRNGSLRTRLRP